MFNFESSSLSLVRGARADQRRNSRRAEGALCRFALLNIGVGLDDARPETAGTTDGTAGAAVLGIGGGAILAALPMPLGSLTELLRPPALPGPRGMPLTPASPAPCANDGVGAARQPTNAKAKIDDLPNIDHASNYPTKVRLTVPRPNRVAAVAPWIPIWVASIARENRPGATSRCGHSRVWLIRQRLILLPEHRSLWVEITRPLLFVIPLFGQVAPRLGHLQ
jgi:hypothetical protein